MENIKSVQTHRLPDVHLVETPKQQQLLLHLIPTFGLERFELSKLLCQELS